MNGGPLPKRSANGALSTFVLTQDTSHAADSPITDESFICAAHAGASVRSVALLMLDANIAAHATNYWTIEIQEANPSTASIIATLGTVTTKPLANGGIGDVTAGVPIEVFAGAHAMAAKYNLLAFTWTAATGSAPDLGARSMIAEIV